MASVSSFCADKIPQAFSLWLTEMLFPISDLIKITLHVRLGPENGFTPGSSFKILYSMNF
jgi:hypothetical protein